MKRKKSEGYRKSEITTMSIFVFHIKNFARKHILKKIVYTITFQLPFLCVAGYLTRSNDIPKLILICISA